MNAAASFIAEPRQIVLLCDGTNNNLTGGQADTHVVKLSELLAAHPDPRRLVFYDPGVGNAGALPGATVWDNTRRWLDRVRGLALGRGVYENMVESYLFLMRHYRPGDQVFIFGFSRGAFTARSVAGLVNQFGVLRAHMESMLPTLLHVYFSERATVEQKAQAAAARAAGGTPAQQADVDHVAQQVRRHFADPREAQADIEFVGVWDTVASVGLPPFSTRFTALPKPEGKAFVHIRQALALDEHRTQFKPRLYAGDNGPFTSRSGRAGTLDQRWFPGSHCDVGGGYEPGQCALSDTAFGWMVSEAVRCGLRLRSAAGVPLDSAEAVLAALPPLHAPVPACAPRAHSELRRTALWAVSGMSVRDTNRVAMDGGRVQAVQAQDHDSVGALDLSFAQHSVWRRGWPPPAFWIALLLLPACFALMGYLLGQPGAGWRDWVAANIAFQQWQLAGWLTSSPQAGWSAFADDFNAPGWALFWDFGFIAAYAVVLSCLAAAAFARIAGLRRAGDPARPWLNRLGFALALLVFADLGENVLTWLAMALGLTGAPWLVVAALVLQVLVMLCGLAKLAGLAGTVLLVLWGMLPQRRRAPKLTPAGSARSAAAARR